MGRMAVAATCAAFGIVAAWGSGCGGTARCGAIPPPLQTSALLELTCGKTDLTSVTVSGPCAAGDASPPYELGDGVGVGDDVPLGAASQVSVTSQSPGVCHVQLVFSTGFTFATDVTFASQTQSSCGVTVQGVGPTQGEFQVNNPAATCLDDSPNATDGASGAVGGQGDANIGGGASSTVPDAGAEWDAYAGEVPDAFPEDCATALPVIAEEYATVHDTRCQLSPGNVACES